MNRFVYGAGAHGKVVLDAMQQASLDCAGFIDDNSLITSSGLKVITIADLENSSDVSIHLAIGHCKTRENLANTLKDFDFFSVVHPAAVVAKTSKLGYGSLLAALSIVGPDVTVGCHCIVNHAAVIDHDCNVGDFVHIAPHVSLGGGVRIGKGVLIGSGAVVLPGLEVGDYAVVGAGAVVTKNVSAGTVVAGNPARILNKL